MCLLCSSGSSSSINQQLIAQIDTPKVLNEIHQFLRQYPSSSWQSRASDLPLRTIKTLVFHLAKGRQEAIMDDLAAIEAPDDSEIKVYVMKLFRNGFQLASAANTSSSSGNNTTMGVLNTTMDKKPTQTQQQAPSSDQIAAVFKKISSTESSVSREGLRELYELKQQHADIDLDKYYKNSSGRLKAYVDEGLRAIEQERSPPSSSSSSSASSSSSSASMNNAAANTKRLVAPPESSTTGISIFKSQIYKIPTKKRRKILSSLEIPPCSATYKITNKITKLVLSLSLK